MSPRYAARIDANQADIVKALRGVGATVWSAAALGNDFPDLIVGFNGENVLMEVKNPERGKRAAEQHDDWHARWSGRVVVVWTVDEALEAIGFREPSDERETTR